MSKVRLSDLIAPKLDLVTIIQYHRALYIYDDNDPRIADRTAWIHSMDQTQHAAAMFLPDGIREKRIQELDQITFEVTANVDYARLISEEVRVEMMDALMDVHDFSHGRACC